MDHNHTQRKKRRTEHNTHLIELPQLPNEIWVWIFQFLPPKTLGCAECVNSLWYTLIKNEPHLQRYKLSGREPTFTVLGTPEQDGKDNTHFKWPQGVALDNGNIIIADYGNHRLQIFDNNGQFIKTIGSKGSGPSQLQYPRGITITNDKHIIVSEHGNKRVSIFDENGRFVRIFGSDGVDPLKDPIGITVNSKGDIIVIDNSNERIRIFDIMGNILHTFGTKGIGKGQFNDPFGVCVDQHDNIIVTDYNNDRLQIFDNNGQFITTFGSEGNGDQQFINPIGVCVDKFGQIIIANNYNNRVSIWSNDGHHFIRHITNLPSRPKWITITPSAKTALISFSDHTVRCLTL